MARSTRRSAAASPPVNGVNLLTAPLEVGEAWNGAARTDAAAVISRMREACLSGIRLVSDRQPDRLRVDDQTSGPPHIWLHVGQSDQRLGSWSMSETEPGRSSPINSVMSSDTSCATAGCGRWRRHRRAAGSRNVSPRRLRSEASPALPASGSAIRRSQTILDTPRRCASTGAP